MKAKFFFLGIVSVALGVGIFSCSRDEGLAGNDDRNLNSKDLVPVSFSVGFSKNVTGSGVKTSANVGTLLYDVYDAASGNIFKASILSGGVVQDSLPEGNYIIVFAAATNAMLSGPSGGNNIINLKNTLQTWPYFRYDAIGGIYNGTPLHFCNSNSDVFYKKISFTVDKNSTNNNSVTLDRIVGKIQVVLQDTIPDDVVFLYATFPYNFEYYVTLNTDYSNGGTLSERFVISDADKKTSGFTFSYTCFENLNFDQSRNPGTITLQAIRELPAGVVDYGQSLVASKVINNVDIFKNQTVVYTGKLFDGAVNSSNSNSSTEFTVSINDVWGDTINKQF